MTAARFAKIAKVAKGTVLHWIRKGDLPAARVRTPQGPGYEIEMDDAQALAWLNRTGKLYTFSEGPTTPEPETGSEPDDPDALVGQLRREVSFLRAELERRSDELRKRAEIDHLKDAFMRHLIERTEALATRGPDGREPDPSKRRRRPRGPVNPA